MQNETIQDRIESKLISWIKDEYPHGYEIYVDYNDYLSEDTISKLIDNNSSTKNDEDSNPLNAFYDYLWENYVDYITDIEDEKWNEFLENENLTDEEKEYAEDNHEEFREIFLDNFKIEIPYDHYLFQRVCCNLVIDNGDWNTEFTRHDCFPHYSAQSPHAGLSRESGMMLIANLQGYSNKQTRNLWRQYKLARWNNKKAKKEHLKKQHPFITSAYHEMWECPSSSSAFVICINVSLKELLEWHKEKTDITIPKKVTTMGLYNFWSGGGSLLEVELEKDIVIPKDKVALLLPDEAWNYHQNRGTRNGYSIGECYGMCEDAWTGLDSLTTKPQRERKEKQHD